MIGTIGSRLVVSMLSLGLDGFMKVSIDPRVFTGAELDLWTMVNGHVLNYGALPVPETVVAEFGELPDAPEVTEYYLEKVRSRYVHQSVKKAILEADKHLHAMDAEKAKSVLFDVLLELNLAQNKGKLVNFTEEARDLVIREYKAKITQGDNYGIQTPWGSLNALMGGLVGGDLLVIAGRPSSGKSYMSMAICEHVWNVQKKVPLFISMEMKPLLILQRAAALHTHTPITLLRTGALSSKGYEAFRYKMEHIENKHPWWVVDRALAPTVRDISLLVRQLHPDVVVVDGAYLLTHTETRVSNWEKVKGVVEDLKEHIAEGLNLPVIANYQLSREAVKKKAKEVAGLEDLAYSDAIAQIASIVLGLVDQETIETLVRKRVQIMKGRSGETGEFWINWIFDILGPKGYMDFSECSGESNMAYL